MRGFEVISLSRKWGKFREQRRDNGLYYSGSLQTGLTAPNTKMNSGLSAECAAELQGMSLMKWGSTMHVYYYVEKKIVSGPAKSQSKNIDDQKGCNWSGLS